MAAAIVADNIAAELSRGDAGRPDRAAAHRARAGAAGSLLASAIALQVFAERLARARSVNPDTLGREDAAQAAAHA